MVRNILARVELSYQHNEGKRCVCIRYPWREPWNTKLVLLDAHVEGCNPGVFAWSRARDPNSLDYRITLF